MVAHFGKRGFTLIELLIVLAIVAFLMCILLPAVQAIREASRCTWCNNSMKQIGLALHNFNSTQNHFPGSGQLTGSSKSPTVGGWSFLVMILPYLEMQSMYATLDIDGDPTDPATFQNRGATSYQKNAQVATAASWPYVCESNPNGLYQDSNRSFALTNYKAMGATCMASLNMLTRPDGKAPYGEAGIHPDGGLFPGPGMPLSEFKDGTSHTILCTETIDNTQSVWTLGTDVTLVGLPYSGKQSAANPGKGAIPSFTRTTADGTAGGFYMPEGSTATFDDVGNVAGTPGPGYSAFRTYLGFDFGPTGADRGTYPRFNTNNRTVSGLPGANGATYIMGRNGDGPQSNQPAYGPSSGHPSVVNTLFGDGSVRCLSKQIDVSAYMFLITRNGGDPTPCIP
jgi:prepilin-type N-terminal cleavage/methylation domain-containing protein/prepilin-type processing-associated H-X9-DG protein